MTGRSLSRLAIVMFLIAVIGSMITLGGYYLFILIQVRTIPMDVTVANKIGFNTDTDALHFGTVYAGGESRRSVAVSNGNPFPVTVSVINSGSLSPYVRVESIETVLGPQSNMSIGYICAPPADAHHGIYNGTSRIVVKRKFL